MKLKKRNLRPFNFFLLAASIFSLAYFCESAEAASREIKIIAAVSSGFKQNPEWQKEIRDRVLFSNEIFEKNFGIHFSIKQFESWEPQDEKKEARILLEELRARYLIGLDEIVIGFHKMSQPFTQEVMLDMETIGSALYLQGYVIIRDPFQNFTDLQRQVVLAHELAHLFGAIHVSDSRAIMHASLSGEPAASLDVENSKIIKVTNRVNFERGAASLSAQEMDQLIAIYESLIRKNPHSDFYYQLGTFYELRKLPARAVAIWEEAVKYQYANPLIHWKLGQYYYENGRYGVAIDELGAAIAFFQLPSQQKARAQVFNFLGIAHYKKGNLEQAIFDWLKGLASDPDNLNLQGNLAAAYLERGDVDRALNELTKLLVKHPNDQTTLTNLGVAYIRKKDYSKAVEYLKKALSQLDVDSAPNQIKSQAKDTETEHRDRLMKEHSEADLRLNLGSAYLAMEQVAQAIVELEQVKKIDPQNKALMQNLTQAYLFQKKYEKALEIAKEGSKLEPQNPYFYSFLAEAYVMTGKRKEAIEPLRQGIRYGDNEMKALMYKNLAVIFAQEGKPKEALGELRNSLNVNWTDPDTHTKIGYLYAQSGQLEEARRSFQTALRLNPSFAEAKKALESLPK